MALKLTITKVKAREILDSRGNPTVEAEVTVETETTGKKSMAAVITEAELQRR